MRKDDLKVTLGGLMFLEILSGYQQKHNTLDDDGQDTNELDINNKAMTSVANAVNDKKIEI